MAMIRTTTGTRAYPTEPVKEIGMLTVPVVETICGALNTEAERLGISTRYVVANS